MAGQEITTIQIRAFLGDACARLLQEVCQRNIIVSIITFFIVQWVEGRAVDSEPLIRTRL
jgi:hypothetical protein